MATNSITSLISDFGGFLSLVNLNINPDKAK